MNDAQKSAVLKAALVIVMMDGGWLRLDTLAHRLGYVTARDVVSWLRDNGYAETAQHEHQTVVRWAFPRVFQELWDQLIPDRPCAICTDHRALTSKDTDRAAA